MNFKTIPLLIVASIWVPETSVLTAGRTTSSGITRAAPPGSTTHATPADLALYAAPFTPRRR